MGLRDHGLKDSKTMISKTKPNLSSFSMEKGFCHSYRGWHILQIWLFLSLAFSFSSLPVFILPWNTSCFSLPLRSILGKRYSSNWCNFISLLHWHGVREGSSTGPLSCPLSALPSSHNAPMVSSAVFPPSESSWGCSRWDKKPRRDEEEEPFHPDPRIPSKSARD